MKLGKDGDCVAMKVPRKFRVFVSTRRRAEAEMGGLGKEDTYGSRR